jgi:hypothetical protein
MYTLANVGKCFGLEGYACFGSSEAYKASIKAKEKLIEEREKRLRLMPDVRVLEWAAVPNSK